MEDKEEEEEEEGVVMLTKSHLLCSNLTAASGVGAAGR